MKNRKSLVVLMGIAVIFTTAFFLINSGSAVAAEKCHIVTIFDRGNISPPVVTIQKGDCVLWINWKKKEDVTVSFKNGAECIKAIKTPVGFAMDEPSGCFLAQALSYGHTVSLVFETPGEYKYDVNFETGGKTNATIVVTE